MRLTRTSRAGIGSAVVAASPFPLALLFKSEIPVHPCLSMIDHARMLRSVTLCYLSADHHKTQCSCGLLRLLRLLRLEIPLAGGKGKLSECIGVHPCVVLFVRFVSLMWNSTAALMLRYGG